MSGDNQIQFIRDIQEVRTKGLVSLGQPEIRVRVSDASLTNECEAFLRFIVDYIHRSNIRISPGETLNYGFWLVKFQAANGNYLDVWEYNSTATEFIPGATLALTHWRDQHNMCSRVGATFLPPRPDKLVVISEGTLEGDPVHGTRYPSPEHMSGWWILTDRWNGETATLRCEHLYHITSARPELARYLALPYGFLFDLREKETITYDENIANQPIQG